ncbi:MAG: hypothetical protein J5U19_08395 [Candidatus Methanoperedens sp.]|nr:hypothetical protein [Candidatus Methanoperedens sp.]
MRINEKDGDFDSTRICKEGEYMRHTVGDNVRFKLESGEVQHGNIQFIEKSKYEEIFYINSSNRWAYKISKKNIIS